MGSSDEYVMEAFCAENKVSISWQKLDESPYLWFVAYRSLEKQIISLVEKDFEWRQFY